MKPTFLFVLTLLLASTALAQEDSVFGNQVDEPAQTASEPQTYTVTVEDPQGNEIHTAEVRKQHDGESFDDWRNYVYGMLGVDFLVIIPNELTVAGGVQIPGGYLQAETFVGISVAAAAFAGRFMAPMGVRVRVSTPMLEETLRLFVEASRTFYPGKSHSSSQYDEYDHEGHGYKKSDYWKGERALGIGVATKDFSVAVDLQQWVHYPDETETHGPEIVTYPFIRVSRALY